MSPILSTFLLAATATAQITTSMWMPSGNDDVEVGFYASIVGVENGKTTMAINYDNDTNTDDRSFYDFAPETITVEGSTWYETVSTTTDKFEDAMGTYGLSCHLPAKTRARPTCVYSKGGELAFKDYCGDYSTYTDVYTRTYERTYSADEFGPATTYTSIETVDYNTYIPGFCKEGSTLPEDYAKTTMTWSRSYISTYQVVITAGQELLAATAGASVTTGTGGAPTGSNAPQQTSGTGAAPAMTAAPALIGLGAAMAAFVL